MKSFPTLAKETRDMHDEVTREVRELRKAVSEASQGISRSNDEDVN